MASFDTSIDWLYHRKARRYARAHPRQVTETIRIVGVGRAFPGRPV